jgi:hypothetical protein
MELCTKEATGTCTLCDKLAECATPATRDASLMVSLAMRDPSATSREIHQGGPRVTFPQNTAQMPG